MSDEPIITPGGSPPGTYSRDAIERGDEPTERDVEALATVIRVRSRSESLDAARSILASDWYAERIAQARREALTDAADALDVERLIHVGDIDVSTWLRRRAALRGDA